MSIKISRSNRVELIHDVPLSDVHVVSVVKYVKRTANKLLRINPPGLYHTYRQADDDFLVAICSKSLADEMVTTHKASRTSFEIYNEQFNFDMKHRKRLLLPSHYRDVRDRITKFGMLIEVSMMSMHEYNNLHVRNRI